ncbi:MAG: YabP/YqfC family sporulation protein [Clostridia bacterium]|nr:YabP/YqfC family sporulation protein [Clostridia bacterium]
MNKGDDDLPSFKYVRHKLSKTLELPEDSFGTSCRLQIIGNCAILCGCKKILKYKSEEITVLTKDGITVFCGEHLKCIYFFEGTIEISGEIHCVRFENT